MHFSQSSACPYVIFMVSPLQQMRRSGNREENKRITMDLEVVLKSHDCPYIVQCLGCFVTESDVWICMELMATCFDKLLKRLRQPIIEPIIGKIAVAVRLHLNFKIRKILTLFYRSRSLDSHFFLFARPSKRCTISKRPMVLSIVT